jgi:hypothetical protein
MICDGCSSLAGRQANSGSLNLLRLFIYQTINASFYGG